MSLPPVPIGAGCTALVRQRGSVHARGHGDKRAQLRGLELHWFRLAPAGHLGRFLRHAVSLLELCPALYSTCRTIDNIFISNGNCPPSKSPQIDGPQVLRPVGHTEDPRGPARSGRRWSVPPICLTDSKHALTLQTEVLQGDLRRSPRTLWTSCHGLWAPFIIRAALCVI